MNSSRTMRLSDRIANGETLLIAGAFDGISAHLVESAGFDGIWVSGFCVSSSKFVPDENVLSTVELCDRVSEIVDATDIPVLVDCDEGYGALLSTLRLVKKLRSLGIGGICVEDSAYPKMNSFLGDQNDQALLGAEAFATKISAIKDVFADRLLIARTEAIIRGEGVQSAIARAECYTRAGADVVVLHARYKALSEFEALVAQWNNRAPLAIIPTKCEDASQGFRKLGVSMVIYANQAFRASVYSMYNTLQLLRVTGDPAQSSPRMVAMDYIFDRVKRS